MHTHTQEFVTRIAFLRQQWFRERTSVLRYTYIACLVIAIVILSTRQNSVTTLNAPFWFEPQAPAHTSVLRHSVKCGTPHGLEKVSLIWFQFE